MRFEQAADGTLHVLYDLVSDDPNAVFFVSLEVAMNEDGTFDMFPTSVSGDIGAGVTPGTDKRIVWEAGRDVERLQIDLFRFRIVTEAAAAVPTGRAGLVVASAPDGASVSIDGTVRGVTPLSLENLAPGEHRIVVNLDGYLENSQVLTIAEGDTQRVRLELTPLTEEQAAAQADSGSGRWTQPGDHPASRRRRGRRGTPGAERRRRQRDHPHVHLDHVGQSRTNRREHLRITNRRGNRGSHRVRLHGRGGHGPGW